MTNKEFKELALFISTASSDELNQLARLMKTRRGHLQEITATQFRVNDQVRFDAKSRGIITGRITKINKKTVKVMSQKGVLWSVSPSLLEAV